MAVKKGMKVGDTFKDGESSYEVKEVLEDGNYISKRLEPNEKAEAVPEAVPKKK